MEELPHSNSNIGSDPDFGFAYNDKNFSDRVLRVEIIPNPKTKVYYSDGSTPMPYWANHPKRRRYDVIDFSGDEIVNRYSVSYESLDGEAVAVIETTCIDGDETFQISDSSLNMDCLVVLHVKIIHISSPILAAKSPFFYKLFSNGMRESEQRHVTLQIHASEEDAFMDLLNFMYSNILRTNTPAGLLDVLMAADKYEVASCLSYCSSMLRNFPMNSELALLYLDLPPSVVMADAVKPLTDAAKEFLALRFKDLTKFPEEVMNLPLAGIEAVLASDNLQVASEDAVFDFAVKWARNQYSKLKERRIVLGRVARLIRFPHMTCRKLRKVMQCNDLDPQLSSKLVSDALFFKAEPPYRQRALLADDTKTSSHCFKERNYIFRPIKVIEFEQPRPQCIVYFDLKKEECQNLLPYGSVHWHNSRGFHLGGQSFFLSARCNMDQQIRCFGLFLGMKGKDSVSLAIDYEFSARQKPSDEFVSKFRGNSTYTGGKVFGYRNLFGTSWTSFMDEDSPFFINGVLHLKAELKIKL